jgi:drug/metabolite transporter (DMT)-like permease
MIAVLLALGASAAWGTADFVGGLRAKTVPLPAVLFVSQGVGLVTIAVVLAALGRPLPDDERLLLSLAAGVAAVGELGLLYLALARGPVIVVAPVAALGAAIPVAAGLLGGEAITFPIALGIGLALLGSLAAGYEPGAGGADHVAPGALLALAAALGIGLFLILFDAASAADPYWATGGMRVAGWLAALGFLVVSGVRAEASAPRRLGAGVLISIALIGLFDVAADAAFATASTHGELGIVSVLSSLYPVVTVALGFLVLHERVRIPQLIGVGLAFAGIVLLGGSA